MSSVTSILTMIEAGDRHRSEDLFPMIYEELRRLAAARIAKEAPGQTLTPTGLVHEAYLRLVNVERAQSWQSRGHFFAAAAEAMRRIMIESARRKKAAKRGSPSPLKDFDPECKSSVSIDHMLAIDEVLNRLADEDPQAASLVKLRVFGDFSITEAGDLLGISRATSYRLWDFSKAWLRCEWES